MQATMATEHLSRDAVIKTYARWAPIYDKVFGSVFEQARRAAVVACEQVGGRVLEVGVGTGISLPYYSPNCRVTGIDISEAMLEVARQRVAAEALGARRTPGTYGRRTLDLCRRDIRRRCRAVRRQHGSQS